MNFYFKIIIDSQEIIKIVQSSYVPFTELLQTVTFYKIIVQYQNREIDIDVMCIYSISLFSLVQICITTTTVKIQNYSIPL